MKRLTHPLSGAKRPIGRRPARICLAVVASLTGIFADTLRADVQWRTPDRFVTPAAATLQAEPANALPDDPPTSQPIPSRIPDPPVRRQAMAAKAPQPVENQAYPEPDDGPRDDGPCDNGPCDDSPCCPRACWAMERCFRPLANRVEVRADWLLWWGKGNNVPPLVTTSPTTTPRTQAGVLGEPGTSILFGNGYLNDTASSGARIALDYWFTCDHSLGAEVEYFGLSENSQSFQASNNTVPVIARPFYNTQTSAADSGIIAYPGAQTGNVNITVTSELQGVEALLRHTWYRNGDAHFDFLAGYRYVRLSDDLRINEFETFIDPAGSVPVGSTLALSDHFNTLNEFQGADLGLASDWSYGRWNFGLLVKIGLGNTSSHVSINGGTVATEPTLAAAESPGGFLAQASNSGQFQRNHFTMLPELGVNLGFDLTRRLRLTCGYSVLYWGAVARTGDQIDLNLAPPQFPPQTTTPNHFPEFRFAMTDYWAQGLNLGLDFRF
jgi:hypothetical protein